MREIRSAGLGLAGPLAALLFLCSVVGFAAARTDSYSHGTKAVSELGAVGAPSAAAFNVLGFGAPGILIIVLAIVLRRQLAAGGAAGPVLLGLSGLALAAAGLFPVDMEARTSATSIAHLVAAQACGFLWAIALFPLASRMRRTPGFAGLGRLTPWFVLFLLVNIAWQVAWQATGAVLPGWGQRIAFAGYFAWAALAGLATRGRAPSRRRELRSLLAQSRRKPSPALKSTCEEMIRDLVNSLGGAISDPAAPARFGGLHAAGAAAGRADERREGFEIPRPVRLWNPAHRVASGGPSRPGRKPAAAVLGVAEQRSMVVERGPASDAYLDYLRKVEERVSLTDPVRLLERSPTRNNKLVLAEAAGWIRPANCLERLLQAEQHARVDAFRTPTEFLSFILRSPDQRRLRVYFYTVNYDGIGAATPVSAPVAQLREEGWTVLAGLHNHGFHPGQPLLDGILAPSGPDAHFNVNFAAKTGMQEAWITNGLHSVHVPASAFSRFEQD